MRRLLLILLVGYALLCSCVAVMQRKLTYFPSEDVSVTPGRLGLAYDDVRLRTDDDHELAAWWIPGTGSRGAVVLCHGNGGNRSHSLAIARAFVERDFGVLTFDYRGYGENDGSPTEDGLRADARAAYDWVLANTGAPPERVLLYGHSLGAAVAIALATERACGGVVVENGFRSLTAIASDLYPWLPVRLLIVDTWDSAERLADVRAEVFVFHGRGDAMIDASHSEALAERAGTLAIGFDGDHNASVFFDPRAVAALDAILDTRFPPGAAR